MLRNDRLSEFEARSRIDDRSPTEKVLSSPRHSAHRPPLRARPQTWHPYVPVEPPVDISSSRSIGVHAILNPPVRGMTPLEKPIRRERTSRASMSSTSARLVSRASVIYVASISALIAQVITTIRKNSRVTVFLLLYPSGDDGLRSLKDSPISISLSGTPSKLWSAAAAGPLAIPRRLANISRYSIATYRLITSPATLDEKLTQFTIKRSFQTHEHRSHSTGPSSFSRSESIDATIDLQPYRTRFPLVAGVPISSSTATSSTPAPSNYPRPNLIDREMPSTVVTHSNLPDEKPGTQAMIPCLLDLKSGSSTQAEKRKANSDASRRFRNRKRNEMQLEQRLNTQQEEIQRQAETIRHQAEEIRFLVSQRDHYRAERNFFREASERLDGAKYSLQRPSSPRPIHLNMVSGMDTPKSGTASSPTSVKREPAPMRLLESVRSQSEWAASDASSTFSSPAGPITGSSDPHHPPPLHYPSQSSTGDISPRTNPASMAGVSLAPLQKPWSRS
ncbi:hypothetical protein N7539_006630 [Penicillium diatomitis]|uniref:BZIP domain-containing protein n=1 Tax=Penicillium diatomitis TaxID=2819901 RepID=A0A9W9X2S8_9EURO|nr:uncharacterized protein N7539_006630 [Penicillium diatomitis]KAJ5480736.1 hypothetical protein N7539_006630 [Penicillium diatomitis]